VSQYKGEQKVQRVKNEQGHFNRKQIAAI